MFSDDYSGPDCSGDIYRIKALEKRLEALEDLFGFHIHDVESIPGVTGIPIRPSSNPHVVEAVNQSVKGKKKK